jgi:hypothetical protein
VIFGDKEIFLEIKWLMPVISFSQIGILKLLYAGV